MSSQVTVKSSTYTMREVCAILRATENTVKRMIATGDLPGAYRLGRSTACHWRIPSSAHAALQAHAASTAGTPA